MTLEPYVNASAATVGNEPISVDELKKRFKCYGGVPRVLFLSRAKLGQFVTRLRTGIEQIEYKTRTDEICHRLMHFYAKQQLCSIFV